MHGIESEEGPGRRPGRRHAVGRHHDARHGRREREPAGERERHGRAEPGRHAGHRRTEGREGLLAGRRQRVQHGAAGRRGPDAGHARGHARRPVHGRGGQQRDRIPRRRVRRLQMDDPQAAGRSDRRVLDDHHHRQTGRGHVDGQAEKGRARQDHRGQVPQILRDGQGHPRLRRVGGRVHARHPRPAVQRGRRRQTRVRHARHGHRKRHPRQAGPARRRDQRARDRQLDVRRAAARTERGRRVDPPRRQNVGRRPEGRETRHRRHHRPPDHRRREGHGDIRDGTHARRARRQGRHHRHRRGQHVRHPLPARDRRRDHARQDPVQIRQGERHVDGHRPQLPARPEDQPAEGRAEEPRPVRRDQPARRMGQAAARQERRAGPHVDRHRACDRHPERRREGRRDRQREPRLEPHARPHRGTARRDRRPADHPHRHRPEGREREHGPDHHHPARPALRGDRRPVRAHLRGRQRRDRHPGQDHARRQRAADPHRHDHHRHGGREDPGPRVHDHPVVRQTGPQDRQSGRRAGIDPGQREHDRGMGSRHPPVHDHRGRERQGDGQPAGPGGPDREGVRRDAHRVHDRPALDGDRLERGYAHLHGHARPRPQDPHHG